MALGNAIAPRLTLLSVDVVLDGPCWVGAILAVNGGRVVLRLVENVDLVHGAKEHLVCNQRRAPWVRVRPSG